MKNESRRGQHRQGRAPSRSKQRRDSPEEVLSWHKNMPNLTWLRDELSSLQTRDFLPTGVFESTPSSGSSMAQTPTITMDNYREINIKLQKFMRELADNSTNDIEGVFVTPVLRMSETETAFYIKGDLSWADKKNVSIEWEDDMVLKVKTKGRVGESGHDSDDDNAGYNCCSAEQSFVLSRHVKHDEIEAVRKNGYLTVTVPKVAKRSKKRSITIDDDESDNGEIMVKRVKN